MEKDRLFVITVDDKVFRRRVNRLKMSPTRDWMKLIRETVTRECAAHDVETLANMDTCPDDWMQFVSENVEWKPFEESVQVVWDHWFDEQGVGREASDVNPAKEDFHRLPPPPTTDYKTKLTERADVRARRSDVRGRFIVAGQDLEAGQLVVREKPFASVLNGEFKLTHCANCFLRLKDDTKFRRCDKCDDTFFCSDSCLMEGLETFHRYECPFLQGLQSLKLYPLAFRMFLHGWHNAVQVYMAHKMISLRSFLDRNNMPSPSELDLLSNWHVIPGEHCLKHAIIAKLFVEIMKGGGLFRAMQNHIRSSAREIEGLELDPEDELLNDDLEHFLGTYLLDNIQRVKFNSFEMSEFVMLRKNPIHTSEPLTDNQDRLYRVISDYNTIGAATYLHTSQFNHSCKPNCNFYFIHNEIVVRTNQRIAAGTEIKISYGPNVMNTKSRKKRRRQLAESYGFNCLCEQCNGKSIRAQIIEEEERFRRMEDGLEDEEEEEEQQEEEVEEEEDEEDEFADLLHDEPMINRNKEARLLEGRVCYKLAEANGAFEIMDVDKARVALLEAKRLCLEMIRCVDDSPEADGKIKRVQIMEISRLETQADELLLMSFGLLGNVHFKCSSG